MVVRREQCPAANVPEDMVEGGVRNGDARVVGRPASDSAENQRQWFKCQSDLLVHDDQRFGRRMRENVGRS